MARGGGDGETGGALLPSNVVVFGVSRVAVPRAGTLPPTAEVTLVGAALVDGGTDSAASYGGGRVGGGSDAEIETSAVGILEDMMSCSWPSLWAPSATSVETAAVVLGVPVVIPSGYAFELLANLTDRSPPFESRGMNGEGGGGGMKMGQGVHDN